MTQRVLGPTGSPRRRWTLLAPLLAVFALSLFYIAGAQAIHDDNLFELGPTGGGSTDILGDDNAANGPDWGFVAGSADDGLFGAGGAPNPAGLPAGGAAASFILDDNSLKGAVDRTTFSGAGGSNKNNDAISGAGDTWHWDSGNVPAKDDLTNAYAYSVIPTSGPFAGDLIIYGGFERVDESGDSHIDLEFFQDDVSLDEAIPCNDQGPDPTPCAFNGTRTIGDSIVSMDFVQGGGLGSVTVREWDGSEYDIDITLGGEGCNAADTVCAFNNGATIDGGPWVNIDKSGNEVTNLLPNSFTEFGFNWTEVVGGTPCISSVMGKTRSSQSFTAELKDFALANFSICSLAWEKRDGSSGADGSHPLQTGATFSVSPDPHTGVAGSTLANITDCTTATCTGEDKDPDAGQYLITNVVTGNYTITETAAPSGFAIDTDPTRTQTVGTGNLNAVVGTQGTDDDGYTAGVCTGNECDFHNLRPKLKITAFGYTNAATGNDPSSGSGTAVYTAKVKNYGSVAATLANTSQLAVTSTQTTGTFTCDGNAGTGNTTRTYGGVVVGAGAEVTLTALTCTYTNANDGAVIEATLTINHDSIAASGSPAKVSFTVQRD